jgi:hypothetical protein
METGNRRGTNEGKCKGLGWESGRGGVAGGRGADSTSRHTYHGIRHGLDTGGAAVTGSSGVASSTLSTCPAGCLSLLRRQNTHAHTHARTHAQHAQPARTFTHTTHARHAHTHTRTHARTHAQYAQHAQHVQHARTFTHNTHARHARTAAGRHHRRQACHPLLGARPRPNDDDGTARMRRSTHESCYIATARVGPRMFQY